MRLLEGGIHSPAAGAWTMIVVTGATGKIGSELVRLLRERGQGVRAIVRSAEKGAELAALGAELAVGDLGDAASLRAAFAGGDKLFLLAPAGPDQVALQHNAIQAAKQAGIRHVVKVSALGAAPDSPVALGRWHAETEAELAASGMAWTVLQPHSFMQNLLGSAGTVAGQGMLYAPVGDAPVALVDTRDVAAVAAGVLTQPGHEGRTYVVTGGEAVTYARVAQALGAATGRPVQYVDVPPEAARGGMLAAGLPEWLVDDLLGLFAIFKAGHGATTTDAVRTIGGREPTTIEQFARDHAAAFGAPPAAA
ncbi:MAG TPA: SDR family oxidoreductase [Longimicrobiaceae bacterium]|nr:SDR family oxidoreductase [Longimicrobiaceae bacterium]